MKEKKNAKGIKVNYVEVPEGMKNKKIWREKIILNKW